MTVFVTIMRHADLCLKATADVASNWRRNDRGNGAFGTGSIPYPGDRSIEVSMNVRVRPHGRPQYFATFPEDLETSGDLVWAERGAFGVYAVKNGKAAVAILAGHLRDEMESREAQPIYFDKLTLGRTGPVQIQMNVSIRLLSAPATPLGDIPEWDTQFFSGGLPSLGKRRP